MKMIIDITEQDFHRVCQGYIDYSNTLEGRCLTAISEGTPIPNNATNGDVIKVMFPDAKYEIIHKMSGMDYIQITGMSIYGFSVTFDLEWWNAPYKANSKDKKLWKYKASKWTEDLSIYDNTYPKHIQALWKCSECKERQVKKSKFCPNCGCRMVEPQERGDKE